MRGFNIVLFFSVLACFCNAQVINIPDRNFKTALMNTKCIDVNGDWIADVDIDRNDDGEIQLEEALQVTRLELLNKEIASLEGIEHFKNLTKLDISFNPLVELELPQNTNLEELSCFNCLLVHIDLSENWKLITLNISKNQLRRLDLSKNLKLKHLRCDKNKLKDLDLSNNPHLNYLNFSYNKLPKIDLYHNIQLVKLECQYNLLYDLNVTNSPMLTYLNFKGNQISDIDLSNNFYMDWLNTKDNPSLECIKVDENVALDYFDKDYHHKIAVSCL